MEIGEVGVWFHTDSLTSEEAVALVQRVEALGYGAFWYGEGFGRDPFAHAALLLAKTSRLVIATGIASIYSRDAIAMSGAAHTLAEQSGGRFLLGIGVSYPPLVEVRGHHWGPPVASMERYLEEMSQAHYQSIAPEEAPPVVLAALGPRMTKLAAERARGSHPCNVTPEWTAEARRRMGPDAWLCVEQKVILETNPKRAREIARAGLAVYLNAPHQQRNWRRMGLEESDYQGAGSDRLVDSLVAWGDVDAIRRRVRAHLDAGATHVCIQPLEPAGTRLPNPDLLEALAPSIAEHRMT
ncbi:MAG: TIGR03620 family F420-dependent LLM class oxidoreductase [Deltaproteobacteria bacterium]|jgi:probable F420-dependent oxidoreductase|nr:TIGR03620 family F420-dependent LLM class oxidoreductase [Deltaproteobacteria bacterium]MBW2497653.1 TIGR03620 family F420-dependent LLM class oxidoreductase [Deltaproteobacteria bacterium]